ncbi:hypothetical protein Plim_2363 [Planctopirus limnophila DSM 3776]|uniref:Uncharacterized protein n=1 Tax=Planctopirus limnophila (strain ATCC 43296 / DSM 3776 / IFAM 1008 / Mu 290) TaxID=521674 RepID=D5SP45_PLAL2|nr:hypothetical protein Plim_2363 [Planctopirus limnophila DSM 3776]
MARTPQTWQARQKQARTKVIVNSGIGIMNLDGRKPCVFESQVHVFD